MTDSTIAKVKVYHGGILGRQWDKTKRATIHPTNLDIAWAAGLFEGEGHARFSNTQHATITMKDEDIIDRLIDLFGGSKTIDKRTMDHLRWSQQYRWLIAGSRARGFLMTIYRFLGLRRQEKVKEVLLHE